MPHALVIVACAEASAAPVAVGIVVMTPALTGATRCDATIYPLIGVPAYRRQVKERLRASARMMGARSLYLDGETLPVTEAHGLAGGDQRRRA
jgi:hypothetical protein